VGPTPRISILREEEFLLASDRGQSRVLTIQLADGNKQPHVTWMHLTASTATLTPDNISWSFQVFFTQVYISYCPSCTYRYMNTTIAVPTGT